MIYILESDRADADIVPQWGAKTDADGVPQYRYQPMDDIWDCTMIDLLNPHYV